MNYGKRGVRAKQKVLNSRTKKIWRKIVVSMVELSLAALLGLVICGVSAGIGIWKGILSTTPDVRLSDVVAVGEASIVYDCEGNEIDQYVATNSNRIQINSMDLIPENLAHAFVAIEDERFYQHNGVDIRVGIPHHPGQGEAGSQHHHPAASEEHGLYLLDGGGREYDQNDQA